MKMVVFSVLFAVLASGCAMGAEGPEDCSGSCNAASFEISDSDSSKLAGTWTTEDGAKSMQLSENGYCQLDNVPCTYTVRATAPDGMFPWSMDIQYANGVTTMFEIELIDTDALTAKHGEAFADYVKTGGAITPRASGPFKPEKPGDAKFDAIQPFGRTPGSNH